ncbi:MAG: hypothetical protein M3Q03_16115 [Chloroflexota bacterium]|nr:hypothetical protein [Chloroflexota bacterium]
MALSIDISHALRTRAELQGLVEAIRYAPAGEPETDWVEWKAGLDLDNDAGHRFETAKHILGFGNRHPTAATPYCEGTAYLLLGVEPGNLAGVPAWDPADIDNWLSNYIAQGRPRWRSDGVEFDGINVIVFTIEAPQWGDRICTVQRGYDRVPSGRIFVRRGGKTIEAGPAEIVQLEERAARGADDIDVDLAVEFPAEGLRSLLVPDHAPRDWVQRERQDLLAPITPPPPRRPDRFGLSSFEVTAPSFLRDRRTEDEYRAEVEGYLTGADRVFQAKLMAAAVRQRLAVTRFLIVNPTPRNFPAAELELRLAAGIRVFFDAEDPPEQLDAPARPMRYGSAATILAPTPRIAFGRDTVSYDGERALVRFVPLDVRPGRRHAVRDMHLGVPAEFAGAEISVEWRVTSTGATAASEGTLRLRIEEQAAVPRITPDEDDG